MRCCVLEVVKFLLKKGVKLSDDDMKSLIEKSKTDEMKAILTKIIPSEANDFVSNDE